MSDSEQRRKTVNRQVRMTPKESQLIAEKAEAFGVTVPQYMRDCALGRPLRSKVDVLAVRNLKQTNADLGRLGGLLKKWLTGDWQHPDGYAGTIRELLGEIQATQRLIPDAIREVAKKQEGGE